MIAAGICFSFLGTSIRLASAELHPFEIVFFRNALSVVFLLPVIWRVRHSGLRTQRLGLHMGRAATGLVAMFLWFTVVTLMPLAEATAISFITPLFASLGAALFLGEILRVRRLTAIAVGFLGMLIIIRPGMQSVGLPTLMAVAGAMTVSISALQIKSLSRTEAPDTIVIFNNLLMTPVSVIPALFVWITPSPMTWVYLLGVGLSATLGHLCFARAFAAADASAVFVYDYIRLPVIALIAFLVFNEVPDAWTWVGAAIIFASSVYVSRREMIAARAENRKPPPAMDSR